MKQVYLVEDHHCVTDAQKALADKLTELCSEPESVLAVEGYLSESISVFDETTGEVLLQQGIISGGLYAVQKLTALGVPVVQLDNGEIYQQNIAALEHFFTAIDESSSTVHELRILATGIDSYAFTAALERANLAFHFQSQGYPATFHAETWLLLVYSLLNLAIDWKGWQTVDRIFTQKKWRETFTEHLSDHIKTDSLFECIDAAIAFYSLNVKRDTGYAKNISRALDTADTLVFALGPFHHQNLSALLWEKGIVTKMIKIPFNEKKANLNSYRKRIIGV